MLTARRSKKGELNITGSADYVYHIERQTQYIPPMEKSSSKSRRELAGLSRRRGKLSEGVVRIAEDKSRKNFITSAKLNVN